MFFVKLTAALLLMGGVALWTAGRFDWIGMHAHWGLRLVALGSVIAACVITYFGALLIMGFRPKDFRRIAK
jgi:putative peptidoglycan lipid II flippase